MAADPSAEGPAAQAIRVEPLSPAVGLWVGGVDLHRLDSGAIAMIHDLWQLGGALLFRGQHAPETAAIKLAAALANTLLAQEVVNSSSGNLVTAEWQMPGAALAIPPKALVLAPSAAAVTVPALQLAGMEAAADSLRMEDPEFLAALIGQQCSHVQGGVAHPLVVHHAQSGEACHYPPPEGMARFQGAERLLAHVVQPRFCWRYDWQAGDVLAVDPRAVRCRWLEQPAAGVPLIAVPGTVPLSPEPAGSGNWN